MYLPRDEARIDQLSRRLLRAEVFERAREFRIERILVALVIWRRREARITRQRVETNPLRKLTPLLIGIRCQRDPTIAGASINPVRRVRRMAIAARLWHLAGDLVLHDRLADERNRRLDLRQLDMLPATGVLALAKADQYREQTVETRDRIAQRVAQSVGLSSIVITSEAGHPRHGLDSIAVAARVGFGTCGAE